MIVGKFVVTVIIAYLLGAIPFGLIIGKRMGGIDISQRGSGNIGGTNVLRTVGIKAGALVAALDIAKGAGAVMLAKVIIGDGVLLAAGFPLHWQVGQVIAALMVMVGHNWSVYIKLRGGKGVAAYYGGWFVMCPAAGLFGGVITLLTALHSRYVSLGSILGALGIMCLMILFTVVYEFPPIYLAYSLVAAGLIIYQHRSNISRLQSGTELELYKKAEK